eukprot:scaffold15398_cov41-Tisochrysis_lutea.AAC.2
MGPRDQEDRLVLCVYGTCEASYSRLVDRCLRVVCRSLSCSGRCSCVLSPPSRWFRDARRVCMGVRLRRQAQAEPSEKLFVGSGGGVSTRFPC